jgi:hypothetical protein
VNRTRDVDLGPGFSVLWTTCNLGAENPGEYGDYYAYGETTGHSAGYNFSTVVYSGTENPLPSTYDAATAYATSHYWGAGYRMPTGGDNSEQSALANCNKTWETQNGKAGYKFYTDYGSVFLPAAGCCSGSNLYNDGFQGSYCSSTPRGETYVNRLYFDSGDASAGNLKRSVGQSVRAVRCMN